jgi:hypothetical protein
LREKDNRNEQQTRTHTQKDTFKPKGRELTLTMTKRAGRFTPCARPDVVQLAAFRECLYISAQSSGSERSGANTTERCWSWKSCSTRRRSFASSPE